MVSKYSDNNDNFYKITSILFKDNTVKSHKFRNYATIAKRELEVLTFCDIYIDLPCHVQVKPLNVHKYHNLDKLIIQVDEQFEQYLEHDINGNHVRIFSTIEKNQNAIPSDIFCSVKAPVKANLFVNSQKDIIAGYFNGDKLHLNSGGNITVDKFQGNSVKLKTGKGNINLKEFIQASTISAEIVEDGVTGFDGKLTTILEKGSADIQLSRITNDSEINILNGTLNLKIADACQDYIQFEVQAEDCDIAENIKSTVTKSNEVVILTPDTYKENTVFVNCLNGRVNIESASWHDMIKLKLQK
ncbi:hypothetical protein NQ314_006531 [Rhamnusium bicolor]|uniref:Adhesin domain-containing protein n=1 Tax=Rhamnusium bicolor TaxID=1586634 RepID=A0AAV8Z2X2_9CUCU|nr:hypothetical protein NQ314_006531 [Rhamnusium bicolor]